MSPTQSVPGGEGLAVGPGPPIWLEAAPGTAGLSHLRSDPRADRTEQTTEKLLVGVLTTSLALKGTVGRGLHPRLVKGLLALPAWR